jgi:peroxiredoxin family protein
MESDKEKLSIVCFSGEFDRAVAAFTLATGAAATNREVTMFFTFWGLNLVKKNRGRGWIGKGFLARFFNFLMGGISKTPLSRFNFLGISPRLMRGMMRKNNVATLEELVKAAKDLKIRLIACEMSMNILGMKKADFIDDIEKVIGVPTFLDYSKDAKIIFI